jgi:2-polyprenyl-3-methyl-5-hydroxy-6-metoxy-1,4-benzoquinol methylase
MDKCSYCFEPTDEILDLGFLPPVNVMDKVSENIQVNTSYPLRLTFCKNCFLTQIGDEIDESLVFPESYPYLSGTTRILRENFTEQFNELINFKPAKPNQLVIDIGSNDGTLLSNYKNDFTVLGVEPTGAAKVAIANNIRTIQKFFNIETAKEIQNSFGKAQVVTACNVFAHIPNLRELMRGIDLILEEDGIFITESHYLTQLLETLQFDTIYHEHLRYYTGSFLSKLFKDFGFEIIRIKKIPTHGGSIRVWAARSGKYDVDKVVDKFLANEKNSQFFGINGHKKFAVDVLDWRQKFRKLIAEFRMSNKSIYGIGAPSRASTLVAFSGLEKSDLYGVGEIHGSHKIGRYMPGTRIPVISEEEVLSKKPDYLLMLSWHIAEELIPKLKASGYSGKFIVPLPRIIVY